MLILLVLGYWIDVFIQEIYFQAIILSLAFCRKEKGMILYGYCIMGCYIHLLFLLLQTKEKSNNQPIKIFPKAFEEKLNYIHSHPVMSVFCLKYGVENSSVRNYCGLGAVLEIDLVI